MSGEPLGSTCASGAASAIAQSLYAGTNPLATGLSEAEALTNATLASAFASWLTSGGDADNVSISTSIGTNGFDNNYLNHTESVELENAVAACQTGDSDACAKVEELLQISLERDEQLAACQGGTSAECQAARKELLDATLSFLNSVEDDLEEERVAIGTIFSGQRSLTLRQSTEYLTATDDFFTFNSSDVSHSFDDVSDLAAALKSGDPDALQVLISYDLMNRSIEAYELYAESSVEMLLSKIGLTIVRNSAGKIIDVVDYTGSTATALVTIVPTSGRKFNQLTSRGWDQSSIDDIVNNPVHTSTATNRTTGNEATAYFDASGSYIVRDNVTGDLVQMSNRNDPNWIPDATIVDPYVPN